MNPFLKTVNYSSSNEDSRSEIRALTIRDRDSVLCITGSGARPLDLSTESPEEIISIDFNPCQNFLLELKMAAIGQLEYEEFLEFLGVVPSRKRIHMYTGIGRSLSAEARAFWDSNPALIANGIIYQGRWERYFRQLARLLYFTRRCQLEKLFRCSTISEQTKIWHQEWNNALWRSFLRSVSARATWRYLFGDPGFYRYVPADFSIYRYLDRKFTDAAEHILLNQSPFVTLLFWGRFTIKGNLPLHLERRNYATLRKNLNCVKTVTQPLDAFLKQCKRNRFQKYSLSDFSSYTTKEEYEQIWKDIVKTARPGARVCERQFFVKRQIPGEVKPYISRSRELENELAITDDSIFYTFVIAEIEGRNCG